MIVPRWLSVPIDYFLLRFIYKPQAQKEISIDFYGTRKEINAIAEKDISKVIGKKFLLVDDCLVRSNITRVSYTESKISVPFIFMVGKSVCEFDGKHVKALDLSSV